jgi:multicomponent Na+:H+ antiporter subunit D
MTDGLLSGMPPGLIMVLAGLLTLLLPRALRAVPLLLGPVAALGALWALAQGMAVPEGESVFGAAPVYLAQTEYLGMTITPVRIDALALAFGTVFGVMALAGGLYALTLPDRKELAALQVYAGSAIGAVTAGDLLTLFVFWEAMAIASTIVIWCGGAGARGAGLRYAAIHFLGGALLMAGAAGQIAFTGETAFTALPSEGVVAGLILIAFLINAAAWPLNAWLPDSYPKASLVGAVFLSAFTTKTAVYALIRGFPGEEMLLWLGAATMLYGIVYALRETEIRRLLCYAIVAQGGFMLCGIGLGTEMGLNGAAGHAAVSILYSAVLFMAAGAVIRETGRRHITDLGGLAGAMPVTCAFTILAALSISAFPGTAAYVSKSLISSGAGYAGVQWLWLALTAAGVGVLLSVGLRFPLGVFFGRDRGLRAQEADWTMIAGMAVVSAALVAVTLAPSGFYSLLPYPEDYSPYKPGAILSQFQLLLFGAIAWALGRRLLDNRPGHTIDTDWLWRGLGPVVMRGLGRGWSALRGGAGERLSAATGRALRRLQRFVGPGSVLASTRPTGYMALWMTLMLSALMVFAFL